MLVPTGYLPLGTGSLNMGKTQERNRLAPTIAPAMIAQDSRSMGDVNPVAPMNSVRGSAR
jgi:hypothetical protein